MAATQTILVIDRQNRTLIQVGSSVAQLPPFSQRDSVPLLIQIADPPANPLTGTPVVLSSADIIAGKPRVTVSQKATGTTGDEATWLLAKLREADFTWDSAQNGFTAILNLNTLQMQNFIGSNESALVEFEVRFSQGGIISTMLPGPRNKTTIWANNDEGADPAVDILNGVTVIRAPAQIQFPSGNLYAVSETGDGHLSFDLVPP